MPFKRNLRKFAQWLTRKALLPDNCSECKYCRGGYCLRWPPASPISHKMATWPRVDENTWCGEFKAR
jgi:hypothetical protein